MIQTSRVRGNVITTKSAATKVLDPRRNKAKAPLVGNLDSGFSNAEEKLPSALRGRAEGLLEYMVCPKSLGHPTTV